MSAFLFSFTESLEGLILGNDNFTKKINPELVYLVVSNYFIPTKKIQISKEHALVFSGNGIGLNASF